MTLPAPETIAFAGLVGVSAVAAWTDWHRGIVPNRLTLPAVGVAGVFWIAVGLLGPGLAGPEGTLLPWFVGLLAGLIPYTALVLLGGLGGGDMKLMAASGAIAASWQVILAGSVYAMILAAAWALVRVVRLGLVRQTAARLLTAGVTRASLNVDPQAPDAKQRTIPFAVAAAVGLTLAGVEYMLGWESPWAWLGP